MRAVRALAVLIAVGIAACTSSSSTRADSRFDPKAAARRIRELGSIRIEGRGTFEGSSGTIAGQIQYRPYEVLLTLPVVAGSEVTGVQYRRIGATAWVRRAVVTEPGVGTLGFPLLVLRGAGMAPFLTLPAPDRGLQAHVGMPYDPALILERLSKNDRVRFRSAGSSSLAGETRARYVAHIPASVAVLVGVRELTVWVDDGGVPVQVEANTLASVKSTYTITASKRAFEVATPPEEQIERTSQPLPDAVGDFAPVFNGRAGTTAVTILEAPGDRNWSCWKVVSNPAYQPTAVTRPGSGAVCIPPVLENVRDDDKFGLAIDANGTTPFELIGIAVPPGSTAEATRVGGTTVSIPVTPDGLAIYAGSAEPAASLVTITLPSGVRLVCGPGTINSQADAAKLTSSGAIRGQPWSCLPEADANLLNGE